MDIDSLIVLAEKVNSLSDFNTDESLALVGEYSTSITSWLASSDCKKENLSLEEREKLEKLASFHDLIVEKIASVKGELADSMKTFKVRSKVIKAYAGINKNRISVFKSRQG